MPRPESTPSIGEQLAAALKAARVSQKELARRLAAANDGSSVETKRRWILKLLGDEIDRPNMTDVEVALNLPAGHFVLPSPGEMKDRRSRLAEVEAEVAQHFRLIQAADDAIELLADRVEALERRAAAGASRPKKARGS